jgi:riboflavin kinase / FMN adenylyltransferase
MTQAFVHLHDPATLPPALHRPVLAIGNFDGMHWGHHQLITKTVSLAHSLKRPAAILTFEPHPRTFFQPDKPFFRLTMPRSKAFLAQQAKLDGLVTLPFNAELAGLSAEAFVSDLLVKRLGVSGVVVGYDFHFGKGRAGSPEMLAAMGNALGFQCVIVPPQATHGEVVSSTLIRALLHEGDISRANAMLGHCWQVSAEVVHGDKRGRLLGYPTANLLLDKAVTLKHGIYAVKASVDGKTHDAVASFGRRPTFDDGAPRLEVHLFDFAGDVYGKTMDVAFVGYIRPELKFDGVEPLIKQMDKDSHVARALLQHCPLPKD